MRWDVHYVDQTASTNADLLALARAGARVGTVVHAGHQTAGRGRLGRTWDAMPGAALLASLLLEAEPVPFVVMARVALAASDACHDVAGVEAALKWPNDLVVGDRKLAGLLAEADAGSPGVVVGIGCNVTWPPSAPDDLRGAAAALSDAGGDVPSPAALLVALLDRLDAWLLRPPSDVVVAYRARCATLGRRIRVALPDRAVDGEAIGITSTGELEVAAGAGTEVIRAGDVVHVRAR